LLLSVDNYDEQENILPHLKLGSSDHRSKERVIFLERAKLEAKIGSRKYVFTAEKGSKVDSTANTDITDIEAMGGRIIEREGRRFVELNESITELKMRKHPNHRYPFVLHTMIPIDVEEKNQYKISITQRNKGRETVGGVSVIYNL
jgi:hypothetical protein